MYASFVALLCRWLKRESASQSYFLAFLEGGFPPFFPLLPLPDSLPDSNIFDRPNPQQQTTMPKIMHGAQARRITTTIITMNQVMAMPNIYNLMEKMKKVFKTRFSKALLHDLRKTAQ